VNVNVAPGIAAPLTASTTDPASDHVCAAGGVATGGVGELGVLPPPPHATRHSKASTGGTARVILKIGLKIGLTIVESFISVYDARLGVRYGSVKPLNT
jgi:hypothetical protein